MAIISSSDITYNLSGGASNSDPDASLGGDISNFTISLERLFDNVTPDETLEGLTEYRCIYIKNNSTIASLYNSEIYISYKVTSDVLVYLGFESSKNERQTINVTSDVSITGGYITIDYEDANGDTHSVNANWNANDSIWASNIESALNSIVGLEDVTVTVTGTQEFEVNFVGRSSKRYHNILNTEDNLIYPSGTVTINVEKNVSGTPINTTSDTIDVEATTPNGINFNYYTISNTYSIGNLLPSEYVPMWIKRVVPPGASGVEDDGITIRIIGASVEV